MNRQLLKSVIPIKLLTRCKGYRHPGGIRYPGGIVYYPRNPEEHVDPQYAPSKLFRVDRIRPVKGSPYWHREILKNFGLSEEEQTVSIVKNIPENNSKLWKIKHLIKITPITFPYGEPTSDDIKHTVLKENGQCVVTKILQPAPEQLEALEQFDNDSRKMNSETIKRDSRMKWMNPYGGGF